MQTYTFVVPFLGYSSEGQLEGILFRHEQEGREIAAEESDALRLEHAVVSMGRWKVQGGTHSRELYLQARLSVPHDWPGPCSITCEAQVTQVRNDVRNTHVLCFSERMESKGGGTVSLRVGQWLSPQTAEWLTSTLLLPPQGGGWVPSHVRLKLAHGEP